MPFIHILANEDARDIPPKRIHERHDEWTDRLIANRISNTYRQCTLGWHEECSDPKGSACECACHEQEPVPEVFPAIDTALKASGRGITFDKDNTGS